MVKSQALRHAGHRKTLRNWLGFTSGSFLFFSSIPIWRLAFWTDYRALLSARPFMVTPDTVVNIGCHFFCWHTSIIYPGV